MRPWTLIANNNNNNNITRMYKTGDLVRYMEDGSIVYIGRGDMQLKLHGQRLEGEEVRERIQESLLDAQLQVIVDIARFAGQDSDVLVAYLAQKGEYRGAEMDLDRALQQHLAEMKEHIIRNISTSLPKYMIPAVFLAVTNIPVTANAKADRRALKAYTARQRLGLQLLLSAESVVQPPATQREHVLHSLWQKLLGLNGEQFGANSNFFELGGSSLAAIKLASAARDLGHSLSAQIIFRNPVLCDMAAHIVPLKERKTSGPARFSLLGKIDRPLHQLRKSLVAHNIAEQDVEDAYPLTRQQQGYMQGEIISPGGTTQRHIMQLPANIDLGRLETALRRVVQSNALLRTRIISVSSQLVQVVLNGDFTCRHVETLSSLAADDGIVSWGLGHRLSRFSIVDGGNSHDRWLVWSSAHVVFDGWGRKLILDDIDYAYYHDDNPPERPQYSKFIEYVYELEPDKSTSTLTKDLQTTKFFTYFTMDGPKIPAISHTLSLSVHFSSTLPPELSYPTALLTAWAIAASHIEQHPHFLLKILLGGRDANFTGIDKLMGPTTTSVPIATSITRSSTFRQHMQSIQTRLDEAGGTQHLIHHDEKINKLLSSVPCVVVHPPEDYEDAATKYLGLFRNRLEMVKRLADPMFMNFCLRKGNTGVDLLLTIDEEFVGVEKAVRYLGCLGEVLGKVFSEGGLDLSVGEMKMELEGDTGGVVVGRGMVLWG